MSACDIASFGADFQSALNKKRVELDFEQFDAFAVGQRVIVTKKKKGVKTGKINRFCAASGKFFADIEFSIQCLKFIKMIDIEDIEEENSRPDLNLTRRRNEAKNGTR